MLETVAVISLLWQLRWLVAILLGLTLLLNSPLFHHEAVPVAAGPGVVFTQEQLTGALLGTGMSYGGAQIGAAVAEAESGGRSDAVCDSCGGVREYSVGPWQINLYAHPKVTAACAEALACAAQAASAISNGGRDWSPWTTFTSGAYRAHMGV